MPCYLGIKRTFREGFSSWPKSWRLWVPKSKSWNRVFRPRREVFIVSPTLIHKLMNKFKVWSSAFCPNLKRSLPKTGRFCSNKKPDRTYIGNNTNISSPSMNRQVLKPAKIAPRKPSLFRISETLLPIAKTWRSSSRGTKLLRRNLVLKWTRWRQIISSEYTKSPFWKVA